MSIFIESPWPAITIGIFAEAVLGLILARTGRGVLLWAMGGVLLVVLGALLLQRLIPTDRKRIEAALDGAAAAFEANNLNQALTFIAADAHEGRALARWAIERVEFTKVKLNSAEIKVNRHMSPPTAKVEVSGYVSFRDRRGEYPYGSQPLKGTLELREQPPGRWLLIGYTFSEDPRKP